MKYAVMNNRGSQLGVFTNKQEAQNMANSFEGQGETYQAAYERVSKERDALAAQVVQMREALELISNTTDDTGVCENGYSASYVAEQALALDTKPSEQIINGIKAQNFILNLLLKNGLKIRTQYR